MSMSTIASPPVKLAERVRSEPSLWRCGVLLGRVLTISSGTNWLLLGRVTVAVYSEHTESWAQQETKRYRGEGSEFRALAELEARI